MKNDRCRKNLAALLAAVLTLSAFSFSAVSFAAQEDVFEPVTMEAEDALEPVTVEAEDVLAQAPEEFDVAASPRKKVSEYFFT